MHEEKVRCEAGGIGAKVGWIHSLSIDKAPIFRTPADIQFGKVTVLHGNNGSGKTALCDWLQGISDPSTLSRWADANKAGNLSFEVTYLDPFKQRLRIRVRSPEEVEYFVNGEPVPFDPNPVRFVRLRDLRQSAFSDRLPVMTDLEFLSKTLSVSPALVRNMMPLVGVQANSTVGSIRVEHHQDGSIRVWTDVHGTLPGLGLQDELSNSERSRVLIEIAAVFARYSAKRVPTVLLLDWTAKSFDDRWMRRVIDFLSTDDNPFQTVLERVTNGLGGHEMARVVNLHGSKSDVTVDSLPNPKPAN
jgi:energy-coupling factor transporter ATP-binding protein EcfA2